MLIYDLEIIKAIPSKTEPRLDGIEYCDGWHDHAGMGVSVIGCYDYDKDRYRVFMQDNFDEFTALCTNHDWLVDFNGIKFDKLVLAANGIAIPTKIKHYDILAELRKEGISGSLDALASVNCGVFKSGNGALAPILWQHGRIGEVIDYCLNDVRLTKLLMDRILAGQIMFNVKNGARAIVKGPERELEAVPF
jgi:RNase_H superfamily